MGNVETWEIVLFMWLSFIFGAVGAWIILKERIRALEALVMAEEPKTELTPEHIAKNLLEALYDHR